MRSPSLRISPEQGAAPYPIMPSFPKTQSLFWQIFGKILANVKKGRICSISMAVFGDAAAICE